MKKNDILMCVTHIMCSLKCDRQKYGKSRDEINNTGSPYATNESFVKYFHVQRSNRKVLADRFFLSDTLPSVH